MRLLVYMMMVTRSLSSGKVQVGCGPVLDKSHAGVLRDVESLDYYPYEMDIRREMDMRFIEKLVLRNEETEINL